MGAGRKRGSRTRRTAEVALQAAENGQTPVEYMLEIMRDETNPQSVRLQAAGMVAPYVHPRLAHIQHTKPKIDVIEELYNRVRAERPLLIEGAATPVMPTVADAIHANQPLE